MAAFPKEKNINSKILVFDWKGNLIAKFKLDGYIYSFTVDEDNDDIYGLTISNEGFSVLNKYSFYLNN